MSWEILPSSPGLLAVRHAPPVFRTKAQDVVLQIAGGPIVAGVEVLEVMYVCLTPSLSPFLKHSTMSTSPRFRSSAVCLRHPIYKGARVAIEPRDLQTWRTSPVQPPPPAPTPFRRSCGMFRPCDTTTRDVSALAPFPK